MDSIGLRSTNSFVLQNLERKIDEIIEKGYADLIKEVEDSRKRILNITINNSEHLGQTIIKEIKTIEKYISSDDEESRYQIRNTFDEAPLKNPLAKPQDKTIDKHSFNPHMPIKKTFSNYNTNSYPSKTNNINNIPLNGFNNSRSNYIPENNQFKHPLSSTDSNNLLIGPSNKTLTQFNHNPRNQTTPFLGRHELTSFKAPGVAVLDTINNDDQTKGLDKCIDDLENYVSKCINEDGKTVFKCKECIYVTDNENHFQLHISDFHKLVNETHQEHGFPSKLVNETHQTPELPSLKSHFPVKKSAKNLKAHLMQMLEEKKKKKKVVKKNLKIQKETPEKVKPIANNNEQSIEVLQLQFLKGVLRHNLMKHPDAWPFNTPVDFVNLNIPDYPKIIQTPMDFGTIKQRFNDNYYNKAQECIEDIQLVFSNCYKFNDSKMDIVSMAMSIEEIFKEQLLKMPERTFRML